MTLKIEVTTKDCLEGVRSLDDEHVSMVLTDPPYFLDGLGDNWDDKTIQNKKSKAKIVGGLPVGMCYDRQQSFRLRRFIEPLARQWMRVTKAGGFILCFSQPRLSHACATAMEDAGIEIRDLLAWKRHGQAKAFSQDHFIRKRKNLTPEEKGDMIKTLGGRKTPQLRPEMETIILGQKPRDGTFVDNWLKHRTGLIKI